MNLYWKAQIVATMGMAAFGAQRWIKHELHLRDTAPTMATVEKIDRTCLLVDNQSGATAYGSCGQRDFFNRQAYAGGKRADLEGKARVSIMYTAPQDGSFHPGELNYTGHDDRFYELKAGDQLPIRVDKADPAHFTLD